MLQEPVWWYAAKNTAVSLQLSSVDTHVVLMFEFLA